MSEKARVRKQQELVDNWNAKWPIGKSVLVKRDNGDILTTKTRSRAQLLSGHTAVIFVEGISGCYALERVEAIHV